MAAVRSMMQKQLAYAVHGAPMEVLGLAKAPVPALGPNDILLKYLVSPINPADINQIEGVYFKSPPLPAVGGNEGVAKVLSFGRDCSTSLRVGDLVIPRVSCLGTWTTHFVGSPSDFIKPNQKLTFVQAATMSVNPSTAYRMLHDFVPLQAGDYIIQNGATSAVGRSVIQIAKAFDWKTINIIRHRPNDTEAVDLLQQLGADHVIFEDDLAAPETRALIQELHPRVAFNCIGGRPLTNLCKALPHGTHVITYGGMSKKPINLPTEADMKMRQKMLDQLSDLMLDGKLTASVETHPLEDWKNAISQAVAPFKLTKHAFACYSDEASG